MDLNGEVRVAVVIAGDKTIGRINQRHTGFVVKAEDGKLWLFDLATHNRFRMTEVPHGYGSAALEFMDPYSSLTFVGWLLALHQRRAGKLPYGIAYEGEYFGSDGNYLRDELGDGLTCATFVIESLKRQGFELINQETWPVLAEDGQWAEGLLPYIPYTDEEFSAQCEHIGKVARYRPEQAVGAAYYYDGDPQSYATVEPAGCEVICELVRMGLDSGG